MFVFHKAFSGWHLATDFFRGGEERKRRRLVEEEQRAEAELASTAYGIPLALITLFNYFGKFILVADNNLPEVVNNLRRAHQKWARLNRMLIRDGADAQNLGHI